jgi:hypothetical protein
MECGFSGFLGDGLVPLRRNHAFVGFILIGMEFRLLAVHLWDIGPQPAIPADGPIASDISFKEGVLSSLAIHFALIQECLPSEQGTCLVEEGIKS